ncbi:uncharacterized protein TRIADDRAFT_33117 [Trichoplax adhaerens]|uniref:Ammonium transporter n=1 Tax=Trichoplax adhaerens TaxID=10228 RepID=B3SC46_TRIAD|nr:hypothetical protein TRIADDRAFT_33117 [Trichoplax adhaerens]EDV19695.1 hypothetical protein TRIADDRAFT_33117 [Trichoplax adhaerens]|eukprot:XP_002117852.1 hypothetical protein TRIADDRAFT_33117 [Trichoplax adhaerens]
MDDLQVESTAAPTNTTTHPYNVVTNENLNEVFHVIIGMIVFFMQAGFAFLEAGSIRSKNTTNILVKNLMDVFIGAVSFWAIGYALAFGKGTPFFGTEYFFLIGLPLTGYSYWWYHYVYAATASTIVSGAVAERTAFGGYLIYSSIITAFIYPIVVHWAWDPQGWLLYGVGKDFAGSSVVHCVGGVTSLTGAFILGPRIGRFDENGKPKTIPGHTVPLVALGGFILIFGLFGFNVGSQFRVTFYGGGPVAALIAVNTAMACSGGGLTALLIKRLHPKIGGNSWSLLVCLNGSLAGIVSICASCNAVYPWAALLIGAIAATAYVCWSEIFLRCKIDDPLDAAAVHMGAGIWGVIAQPIFNFKTSIFYTGFTALSWARFGWNLLGLGCIILWTGLTSGLMFYLLNKFGMFRVSEEIELKGLDLPIHGEPAYPRAAYGSGWGMDDDYDVEESIILLKQRKTSVPEQDQEEKE